jgi:hypothetical protein
MTHSSVPPLVSILINNYNYGTYVGEAVRSALDQTWPRIEVVVVDDGSTDDSLARLALIPDPALRVIARPNGGQAAAYNTGFAAARGEYVLFLDSDDVLDPDVVESAIGAFAPGVVKVQFALRVVDRDGHPLGRVHPPELQDVRCRESVERFGSYASPPGSGNLFARSMLDRIMPIVPESEFRYGADAWPILMAPFFGDVVSLTRTGGSYRVHLSGASGVPRVIGNANADPVRSVFSLSHTASLTLNALATRGLAERSTPELPPPALLRSWTLARLSAPDLAPARLYGRRLDAPTMLRSVAGWSPYPLRKKLAYIGWLVALGLPPLALSRSLQRFLLRTRWT